jgi:hypothetical protein
LTTVNAATRTSPAAYTAPPCPDRSNSCGSRSHFPTLAHAPAPRAPRGNADALPECRTTERLSGYTALFVRKRLLKITAPDTIAMLFQSVS